MDLFTKSIQKRSDIPPSERKGKKKGPFPIKIEKVEKLPKMQLKVLLQYVSRVTYFIVHYLRINYA